MEQREKDGIGFRKINRWTAKGMKEEEFFGKEEIFYWLGELVNTDEKSRTQVNKLDQKDTVV